MAEADALKLLEKIKNFPCPVCGAVEWRTFGVLGNLLVAIPAKTPSGELIETTDERGSLPAFAFTCWACGFIRLHSEQVMVTLSEALPDEAT